MDRRLTDSNAGVLAGLVAYLLWGSMPFYFLALHPAGPWEIVSHRVVWSLVLCAVLLAATRQLRSTARHLRSPRVLGGVTVAAVLIATNWTVYLVAVTSGRVAEAALGYFLNPLFSVALGLVVLRERLRPLQWVAVGIGAAGAVFLSVVAGSPSWIAGALALSFGLYGLMKKRVGLQLGALPGLAAETLTLAPVAALVLALLAGSGMTTFTGHGAGHAALLASTGLMTTAPLILFAASARRVSLVTVGLLQFIAPVLQFLSALALGEHMSSARWIGFVIVWVALLVLLADVVGAVRSHRKTSSASRLPQAT